MESCVPSKEGLRRVVEGMASNPVSSHGGQFCHERESGVRNLTRIVFLTVASASFWLFCVQPLPAQSTKPAQSTPSPGSQTPTSQQDVRASVEQLVKNRAGQLPPLQKPQPTQLPKSLQPQEPNDVNAPPSPPEKEEEVKEPLSRIEQIFSGQIELEISEVSLDLKQFGYDVFQTPVTTFAPVTNVPVGPDYAIGPGDAFTLTLWGRVDAQYPILVDRNGQIILPEVGALKVWGMKFGELEGYLQHELSRKFTDFKICITMDKLRSIQVFTVGDAVSPGSYTVSSLSTVINALVAAGGPSKNGSLRRIRLLRNGQDPVEIDLYDFLLGGDKTRDVRLQDGDTIFIPIIGPVVAIAGNVRRPAIYEMNRPTTLREALDLAGGAGFTGWLHRVQVERIDNHERRIVVDFDMSRSDAGQDQSPGADTVLRDGDVVKVFAVRSREEKVVHLEGHAVRPGKYQWQPGMRLRDVLSSYDVLESQPNLDHGEIERLVPPDLHPRTIPFHLGKLLAGDASENIELAQYDTIRIFRWDERKTQTVNVSGMVFDPNQYQLVPDMRVSDLVDTAGGLQKNAYLKMAEVTRRHITQDGMTTEMVSINLAKALAGNPQDNILLQDYDHLVVRPIPELEFNRKADIQGEVRFPGTYPIQKGEKLSSLIERAGGYTEEAYLKGAVFTRESARKVQRERLDELIKKIEESMLSSTQQAAGGALDVETVKGQQVALETKRELLDKLREAEVTGRVVVKLSPLTELRQSRYDVALEPNDVLVVPQMPGVVYVIGEVFNPTSLLYEKGRPLSYYLRRVGGMTKEADKKQLSVVKADGSVVSIEQGNRARLVFWDSEHKSWFFGGFMNTEMEPGDTIVVPRKMDRFFWLKTTKDLTQIVFQIAVAAGIAFAI